jgi:restriction system protein
MTIPDYQKIMLPLLDFSVDEKEHSIGDAIEYISHFFNLTEQEREELLPSGQQYIIDNRVGWAKTYLLKAGLIQSLRRSYFNITEVGLKILKEKPLEINNTFLKQFPSFVEFRKRKENESRLIDEKVEIDQTPQELIEYGYQKLKSELVQDIIASIHKCSPRFFERLVVDLLLKMGYGGTLSDAGKAIGQSGDGGIDGIIKEDRLGLDAIYIQAKRWEAQVGSKEVRNFVGSLVGQKAIKGVFITTSAFTKDALEYVQKINHKVILIDGDFLAQLMIENGIGVTKVNNYEIKKVDSDYFSEE